MQVLTEYEGDRGEEIVLGAEDSWMLAGDLQPAVQGASRAMSVRSGCRKLG